MLLEPNKNNIILLNKGVTILIPKVIHYCWFGGEKLPKSVQKCIESWRKYCPDFKIKEWNESNFDLKICDYVEEAVEKEEWAFVSDYARFWILYNYGGVYLDTDVELIKPLQGVLDKGPFMGCEEIGQINPGLGMAATSKMKLYKEVLTNYSTQHFLDKEGNENLETVVTKMTRVFTKYGYKSENKIQKIDGVLVYPPEYFCPIDYRTGKENITNKTISIHHYTASWHSRLENLIVLLERNKDSKTYSFRRTLTIPLRIIDRIKRKGITNTIKYFYKAYIKK